MSNENNSSRSDNMIEHDIDNEEIIELSHELDTYRLLLKFAEKQESKIKDKIKDSLYGESGGEIGFQKDLGFFNFTISTQSRLKNDYAREVCYELGHKPELYRKKIERKAISSENDDGRLTFVRYSQMANAIMARNEDFKELFDRVKGITSRDEEESNKYTEDDVYKTFENIWALRKELEDIVEDKKEGLKNILIDRITPEEMRELMENNLDGDTFDKRVIEYSDKYIDMPGGFNPQADQYILHMGELNFSSRETYQFDAEKYFSYLSQVLANPENSDFDKVKQHIDTQAVNEIKDNTLTILLQECKEEILEDPNLLKTLNELKKESSTKLYDYVMDNGTLSMKDAINNHIDEKLDSLNNYTEEDLNRYISTKILKDKENKQLLPKKLVTELNKDFKNFDYELVVEKICEYIDQNEVKELSEKMSQVSEEAPDMILLNKRTETLRNSLKGKTIYERFDPSRKDKDKKYKSELLENAKGSIDSVIDIAMNADIDGLKYLGNRLEKCNEKNIQFNMFQHIYREPNPDLDNVDNKKPKKKVDLSLDM